MLKLSEFLCKSESFLKGFMQQGEVYICFQLIFMNNFDKFFVPPRFSFISKGFDKRDERSLDLICQQKQPSV